MASPLHQVMRHPPLHGNRPGAARLLVGMLLLALLSLTSACTEANSHGEEFPPITNPPTVVPGRRVNVVATTTQVADFTRVVGGERVAVTSLVKPGVDPHEFAPAPQDAQRVAEADLIVINGLGLEGFLEKLVEQAGGSKPVAVLARDVKPRKGSAEEAEHGDPHVWFDPRNVKTMVDTLAGALAKVDPAGAAIYQANAGAYKGQLDELDRRIEAQIEGIPKERRKLITTHESYGYYAARYGFTYAGSVIPSLETNAEPSAKQLAAVITRIKKEKVPAVFAEASVNPRLTEQIARDAGVRVVATLCADSLTAEGTPCATYLGMMEHDTRAIVDALQ